MILGVSGVLLYALFLQVHFGTFMIAVLAQQNWCHVRQSCGYVFLGAPVINAVIHESMNILQSGISPVGVDIAFTVLFLVMTIPVYIHAGASLFLYSLFTILLPLVSFNSTFSMTRYVYAAFPVFMVLPFYLRNRYIFMAVVVGFFVMQLFFVTWFTNGLFVG